MMKITDLYFQNSAAWFLKFCGLVFKIPKINPDKFHTKWPKNGENYGSLFFKILKTSKNSEIIFQKSQKPGRKIIMRPGL